MGGWLCTLKHYAQCFQLGIGMDVTIMINNTLEWFDLVTFSWPK